MNKGELVFTIIHPTSCYLLNNTIEDEIINKFRIPAEILEQQRRVRRLTAWRIKYEVEVG